MTDAAAAARAADWLGYFDRTYIINLPARVDRRREIEQEFAKVGLSAADPRVTFFPGVRPADAGGFPTIGTHGCFLSHLGVLRAAAAAGHDRILLLEDDADFTADFAGETGAALLTELRRADWSFFYGGCAERMRAALADRPAGLHPLAPEMGVETAHMVAFRGAESIARLVAYLEAMLTRPTGSAEGGPMHVDGAYGWFRRDNPALETHLALPVLAVQRASRTDIHALRWYDRVAPLRPIVAAARRLRR